MSENNEFIIPVWPQALQAVDIVKVRFVLDFLNSCTLQPTDFLSIGRVLRGASRQMLDSHDTLARNQWEALFLPPLSDDPVARKKFQKPAPAYVMTMPIGGGSVVDAGDQIECEVLFVGTGIPLIHVFLRSLIHLGHLGLHAGEGHYEITEVYTTGADLAEDLIWRQNEPLGPLPCAVQPLPWFFRDCRISQQVNVKFDTPARLIVDGRPLRKPRFSQVFPFMLRRVTSMLYAHAGQEFPAEMTTCFDVVRELDVVESNLGWSDWRTLRSSRGLSVGGFQGNMVLTGHGLEEIYWILAVASLFGIGKGATYGAGRIVLQR